MARIPIGTKTFGAIKIIESTPLTTQFFMSGYVPIIPIKSFYLLHEYEVERGLLSNKQQMRVVNLKDISFLSVGFAYLRAFFIISAFFSIVYFQSTIQLIPIALFILSVTIVFLSYKLGQQVSITEEIIRKATYSFIGIAVDPAIVEEKIARNISHLVYLELKKNGCNDWKLLLEEIAQNTSLFKDRKNENYSIKIKKLLLVKIRAAIGCEEIKQNKAIELIQHILVEDISNQQK